MVCVVNPDLARRPLRRHVPRQLRPDPRRRRAQADQRDQRRHGARPEVRHAGLDAEAPNSRLANNEESLPTRGDPGDPAGERPGRRRQDRRPARPHGSGFRAADHGQGAAREGERIRGDHRPSQRRRLDRPPQGRRPGRALVGELRDPPATSTASRPAESSSTSTPTPTPWPSSTRSARRWNRIKKSFPEGLDYTIVYNTTEYVDENIREVEHTLVESFVLVMIVVFVFLQGFRATIIPMLAIPVSLVATFAAMGRLRLLDQLADALRAGLGHRPGGGRRDHRGRECREIPPSGA